MPRKNRRAVRSPAPPSSAFRRDTEEHADGEWIVQAIAGQNATKPYRCPGCDQLIPAGTPHVVAWRTGDADVRRHWHRPCWNARDRRRPTRRR